MTPTETNKKKMYRVVVTAQAVADVFVRAKSDVEANDLVMNGKGQRTKARFGQWGVCMKAIEVHGYEASDVSVRMVTTPGLTQRELNQSYMSMQRSISLIRGGPYTDRERQAIADAVREFFNNLKAELAAKEVMTAAESDQLNSVPQTGRGS